LDKRGEKVQKPTAQGRTQGKGWAMGGRRRAARRVLWAASRDGRWIHFANLISIRALGPAARQWPDARVKGSSGGSWPFVPCRHRPQRHLDESIKLSYGGQWLQVGGTLGCSLARTT